MRFDPRMIDGRAMRLAGLRREHPVHKAASQVPLQWAELMGISPLPGQIGEIGYGIREPVGTDGERFAYTPAVEVERLDTLPARWTRFDLPAARYAVFADFEHVADLRRAWPMLLDEWLPRSGFRRAATPSFERYDESFDPLAGRGGMAIWLAVEG